MVFDLHCDTIAVLAEQACESLRNNSLCVDEKKLVQSNYLAQFFAVFVDGALYPGQLEQANKLIDFFERELLQCDKIVRAVSYQEVLHNQQQEKISALLSLEDGGILAGKLENLYAFYQRGVRLITLTWNYPNAIGYPNFEWQYQMEGLTAFGKEVVREMNRLGMLVDVSHLSDAGFFDVVDIAVKPFIASHSNARALTNHPRNLTDEMIVCLSTYGGVIGLNFAAEFLGEVPKSRISDMVRHVNYIYEVGGADCIALGTDFDGTERNDEILHCGQIEHLLDALQKNGMTTTVLDKFMYKNCLRVCKECL